MSREVRVLILDDEQIVCDRLKPALEKLGFLTEAYTDSEQAVARLAAQRFDVLVTDLKMPGVGGMDVLSFVQKHSPATKVIVITGFATTETAERALAQGAVEFIPKPFKMRHLRDLIVRLAQGLPARETPIKEDSK
jgi:DNA-binding NtrC family response regulator